MRCHGTRDVSLNCENVADAALITVRPHLRPVRDPRQPGNNEHAIARAADTAIQQVSDAERARCPERVRAPGELFRRDAAEHLQTLLTSEQIQNLVRDPRRKITLALSTEVIEREHCDGRSSRRGRRPKQHVTDARADQQRKRRSERKHIPFAARPDALRTCLGAYRFLLKLSAAVSQESIRVGRWFEPEFVLQPRIEPLVPPRCGRAISGGEVGTDRQLRDTFIDLVEAFELVCNSA